MTWVLQIENTGSKPFVASVDTTRMVDNTGKDYPLSSACGGSPLSGSFGEPATLGQGETWDGYIAFQAKNIPAEATYFDLHLTLSGTQLVFRYRLAK